MTDEPESQEEDGDDGGPSDPSPPIELRAPDGSSYVITCEVTLRELLEVDHVAAYRATDDGLEFLAGERRWRNVEIDAAPLKAGKARKN